ncbi:MAG: hypothetical protein ACRD50_13175 [Candidatus Acidiferrales bacterium]
MPDWEQMVLERLAREKRCAELEPEVAEELAHYLEDVCQAGLQAGLSKEESVRRAWAQVNNWPRLARNINEARGGTAMLKQRIERLWLPGIVNMIVTFGILLAVLWVGRQPHMLASSPRIPALLYFTWLPILPVLGALAANWSRRAGGSAAMRVAAALFPATTMIAIYLTFLSGLLANHGAPASRIFEVLPGAAAGIMFLPSAAEAILLPALALLAGALPFLRKSSHPRSASADTLSAGAV